VPIWTRSVLSSVGKVEKLPYFRNLPQAFLDRATKRLKARITSALPKTHPEHLSRYPQKPSSGTVDKRFQLSYFALQSLNRMNSLNKALSDISNIRRQVAHSTEFRGYGPATLASTGILAFAAAAAQALRLRDPANHMPTYLSIWIAAAALSAAMIGIEMYARTRRIHSGLADEMIRMAVEQFLPSVGAGALITLALVRYVPAVLWMLPGLWQIVFSLGVFSSCRFLPRPVAAVGAWYLLTGLTCVALGDGRALSPWAMGIPYGVGQLLVAGILLFSGREERDAS